MPTKLVLFDIDGTLVSAFGAGLRSLQEAFAEVFGRPDVASDLSPSWFAGRNDMWIFREVALAAGITPWEYERRYAALEGAYLARLGENMARWEARRILPGVRELLDTLSGDGSAALAPTAFPLGLVTGNLEGGARIKLGAFDLNRYFPAGGFGSDAVDRAEIATIARRRFERRLGGPIPASEVLMVGDTARDIEAAHACGYRVLAVATGTTPSAELARHEPDLLLDDLTDPAPILAQLA